MTKPLLTLMLGVLALILQGLAILSFAEFLAYERSLSDSVLWQIAAAVAAGSWAANAGSVYCDGQWRSLFLHALLLCLLLPVVGQLLIATTALSVLWLPVVKPAATVQVVQVPRIVPGLIRQVTYGAAVRMRARLRDASLSADERLQALVGLRELPPNVTGGLLRELLSDQVEEIRLLAYGIFEAAENRIRQEILIARQLLDSAKSDAEHTRLAARLAELHWELIYQDLVHGELRQFTLRCVREYAHESLVRDATQAHLWCLLGRSALVASEPREAREYLLRAQDHGYPVNRLASLLAEADFQQRRQDDASHSVSMLDGSPAPAAYEISTR